MRAKSLSAKSVHAGSASGYFASLVESPGAGVVSGEQDPILNASALAPR